MELDAKQEKPVDAAQEPQEQETKKNSLRKEILSYVWVIVIACALAFPISRYVLINAQIPSNSMENLLTVKDRLYGLRLAYLFEGPKRYDIVMFKYPVNEKKIYIKRVIGLPGETVEIKKGKIYINGASEPIEENYLPEKWVNGNDGYFFEVPQDCYFMLGDNRNISEDARYWAQCALDNGVAANEEEARPYTFVHKDKIVGRAIFKYYPKFDIF